MRPAWPNRPAEGAELRRALATTRGPSVGMSDHTGWPLTRLVNQAILFLNEKLVEDERVGLLAEAPENHEHDDLQVL